MTAHVTALCPLGCGWSKPFPTRRRATRAVRYHVKAGNCAPDDTRARVLAAGLVPERSEAEWVARFDARPDLFDDLCRVVLGGEPLRAIATERRAAAEMAVAR